ncbi:MAG: phosphoribosylanthranilate isomerase, partial [Pirellulaceae bacterium]
MFEIKICGVRLKSDIDAVAQAAKQSGKSAAVGLNFYPPSVRYVDPTEASTRELSDHAKSAGLIRVGVFVNETSDTISQIATTVGLDIVQLHGDEPIETAQQLIAAGHTLLRAIKLPTANLTADQIHQRVSPWSQIG